MLGVFADNHYLAFSFYDLALFADLLNGWFNLHFITPFLSEFVYIRLFSAPCDSSLIEVVYRHLNGNLVTGQYSDIIHSELSRNVSRYYMLVGKLYLEGRVGECLNYRTLKLYYIILRQNNPSSAIYSVNQLTSPCLRAL